MKLTKPQREQIRLKYDGKCAYCGCELSSKFHVDHLVPQMHTYYKDNKTKLPYATMEEVYCLENLMPSCPSCNIYKSANSLESFRRSISKQIDILRRDRPTFRLAERYGLIECKPKEVKFYFESYE